MSGGREARRLRVERFGAGGYLLHPFPGFVTGYDIVGVVEEASVLAPAIRPGTRVVALLPRMGEKLVIRFPGATSSG
ncbi:hypothetical protein ELQ90_01975 [Labedella phragmitis]|uniref:Uncharacterized protein n=1 Tax=Labedella phragmitis TaxID=2498849 RepID=A0A444PXY1_9MICO|nr:hypothetical protein [Labedella phragmitis]RWZ52736.1 hypothetical protein ELQ90_01975 [Labedella phragmitis]